MHFLKKSVFTFLLFMKLLSLINPIIAVSSIKKSISSIKTTQNINQLPKVILDLVSSRKMRVHHYLWHSSRNGWLQFDDNTRQQLTNIGWAVPRPARDESGILYNNGSGEDFLYMHRQMIIEINNLLANANLPYGNRIVGWTDIPGPTDPDYPVPPPYGPQSIQDVKTDSYYTDTLKPLNDRFKDPAYLSTISLGELGARLEFDIHNSLHSRWSTGLSETRPDPNPFYNVDAIEVRWDDVSYDWLNDFYSSHVHFVFYKIHGWIDDRINDWQKANNLTQIVWNYTWMGNSNMTMNNMLEISRSYIFFQIKGESSILENNFNKTNQINQKNISHYDNYCKFDLDKNDSIKISKNIYNSLLKNEKEKFMGKILIKLDVFSHFLKSEKRVSN